MQLTNTLKNLIHKEDKEVTLWHISSDSKFLKSFLNEGIQAKGTGQGGQTGGFFVWNNKEEAISHFSGFLHKNEKGEGLLVGTKVKQSDIHYPDWQFDIEFSKELSSLFFKYKDTINGITNFEYLDDQKIKKRLIELKVSPRATPELCPIRFKSEGGESSTLSIGDGNGLCGVDMFQALVDHLCKDETFRKDYDQHLAKHVVKSPRLALKYCGKKTLSLDEVYHIQKDEKDSHTKQELLYTSSKKKEEQVCPFLTMQKARKQK